MMNPNYHELESQLFNCLNQSEPDFIRAKELLAAGADINAAALNDPDADLLSTLLLNYWECGDTLCIEGKTPEEILHEEELLFEQDDVLEMHFLQLITFFLSNGFDVKKNGGLWGFNSLRILPAANFIEVIIESAKLLLKAGASNLPDREDDVLAAIRAEQNQFVEIGDFYSCNLLETYAQMIQAPAETEAFYSLDSFEKMIDRTITAIHVETSPEYPVPISYDQDEDCGAFFTRMHIVCNGGSLIINSHAAAWTDCMDTCEGMIDVTSHFPELAGKQISDIYSDGVYVNDNFDVNCPALYIMTEDSTVVFISDAAVWDGPNPAFTFFKTE